MPANVILQRERGPHDDTHDDIVDRRELIACQARNLDWAMDGHLGERG